MELVSFIADGTVATAGIFSALTAVATMLVGSGIRRKKTQKAIEAPSAKNPLVEALAKHDDSITKVSEAADQLQMDFTLSYPNSASKALFDYEGVSTILGSHKKNSERVRTHLALPDSKEKPKQTAYFLQLMIEETDYLNSLMGRIEKNSKQLTHYTSQREKMLVDADKVLSDFNELKAKRTELEERYSPKHLRELPQMTYKAEKAIKEAHQYIVNANGTYVIKREDVKLLNMAEEKMKTSYKQFTDYLHSLENFHEEVMSLTDIQRTLLNQLEPNNPTDLKLIEDAHLALYKAETHEYNNGDPLSQYREIIKPVEQAMLKIKHPAYAG